MIKIIGEIGINHNGSIEKCKELIDLCKLSGCDYAKIQKREPDLCVPENQKTKLRETPWGTMTYLDYKKKIEFNEDEIKELIEYSKNQLHNFRNNPTLDNSEQGLNLYKLELLIYSNCCDYFHSL